MLASYNWLKEHVNIKQDAHTLARQLTLAGLEVSNVQPIYSPIENCVIGRIKSIAPHPNADRLKLTKVDVGSQLLDIVCGANNIQTGQYVPVAKIGCTLPSGLTIKSSKIRGEHSAGMICSQEELGLEQSSDGVWILSDNLRIGHPISSIFPKADFILDFNITSNRSDCMHIIGLAKEIAALNNCYFSKKEYNPFSNKTGNIKIELKEPSKCGHYSARLIKGIKIKASPAWLSNRLEAHGIRSINNVVDITNYILLEYGQPLHAFSLERLKDQMIIIRNAKNGELFTTLDNRELTLTQDDLVIADCEKAVALAGVIGGNNSGIHNQTTEILLECAHFDPQYVRSTSRRHNIETDSSIRFGRQVDISSIHDIINYATGLIIELAGGEVSSSLKEVHNLKVKAKEIHFRFNRVEKDLGLKIEKTKINKIFQQLGFQLTQIDDEKIKVTIPLWRNDLEHEWDLVEEIARIYGYNNIPGSLPSIANSDPTLDVDQQLHLRKKVQGLGYDQVINLSFVENRFLEINNLLRGDEVKINNPVTVDIAYLRSSLLFGLLSNLKLNIGQHLKESVKIYEIGHIFSKDESGEQMYTEHNALGLLGFGQVELPNWCRAEESYNYYHLAQDIRELLDPNQCRELWFKQRANPIFSKRASASIQFKGKEIGMLGCLKPSILQSLGIKAKEIFYAEINWDLLSQRQDKNVFKSFSPYPSVYRDFAIVAPRDLDTNAVMQSILKFNAYIQKVHLMDIYMGEKVANGKMSVVYNIEYQSFEHTLTKEAIDKIEQHLSKYIVKTFAVNLR